MLPRSVLIQFLSHTGEDDTVADAHMGIDSVDRHSSCESG